MDLARKLIRPNPCDPIIRNDTKRAAVLHDLVKILETHETLLEAELRAWVEAIKI
jgi:HD superfamily phosphohydrolase YqeK